MKKLLGTILAISMIATSFVSAFAAGSIEFSAKADKTSVKEGDKLAITITIVGDPFCAFGTGLEFNDEVFEFVNITKPKLSDLARPTYGVTGNVANATFGVEADQGPIATDGSEEWEALYTYVYNFKVKDSVYSGNYDFVLSGTYATKNAAGEELEATYTSPKTIAVTGTKTDGPTELKATADMVKPMVSPSNPNTTTQGITGKVDVPAGMSFSKLVFTLNNGSGDDKYWTWDLGTAFETSVESYGVNILGVPSGITITCSNVEAE